MATSSSSPVAKRRRTSEYEFCSKCVDESAERYCKHCRKFYCRKCVLDHSQNNPKHSIHGKEDINKWPVSRAMIARLQTCERHNETIKLFCKYHSQLCCSDCFLFDHRQCTTHLKPISESVRKPTDPRQHQDILEQLKNLENIKIQQDSYDKQERLLIEQMRHEIKTCSFTFGNSTLVETHEDEQSKEEMRRKINSILTNSETSVKGTRDQLLTVHVSHKIDIDNCIRHQKELRELHDVINNDENTTELSFIVNHKFLNKMQKSEMYLKDYFPNRTFTVKNLHDDNNTELESFRMTMMSVLTSICVLPDGQMIAADIGCIHVKLFDQQYKILDLCDISPYPYKMCQITNNTVGVTVNDDTKNVHEVQFIEIRDRKLVKRRAVVLPHACLGISHRQGDLYMFVTSGTALYKYMLSGVLICKLYENKAARNTVHSCAVNPTGDIIYITNYTESRLLTLNRDGAVLFSFNDPELQSPSDVHVTHGGQVLICGRDSNTIIQVDCEGRQKLTTLATWDSKLMLPESACYNKQTSSIIVGHHDNIKILVIKVV